MVQRVFIQLYGNFAGLAFSDEWDRERDEKEFGNTDTDTIHNGAPRGSDIHQKANRISRKQNQNQKPFIRQNILYILFPDSFSLAFISGSRILLVAWSYKLGNSNQKKKHTHTHTL